MARTGLLGEPEASDDSVSLTSTVSSVMHDRYEVDCILAEKKSNGVMLYLTAWKGYQEHRHSWEPRECFFEDEVFGEWTRTQMRVTRGHEKPFDVKAWRARCKAVKEETRLRRERRADKKLRLSNRDVSSSRPREQNAGIESSGLEKAPRRPDKRIKRGNVHHDSPPSSSISSICDPSSSSSSEDSDRPLISRQQSETLNPNSKWTQAETIALEEGLRTLKGPSWMQLLSLYGRNGTISQVLKDKNPRDLYDKAYSVRQEFVDSGREPPEYLKPFSKSVSGRGSGSATPTIYSGNRGQSRVASQRSSRNTSVDSMMGELHDKQRLHNERNQENNRPQQTIKSMELLKSATELEKSLSTTKKLSGSNAQIPKVSRKPPGKVEVGSAKKQSKAAPAPEAAQIIHPKNAVPHTRRTTEAKESTKNESFQSTHSKDSPRAEKLSKATAIPQAERQPKSLAPIGKVTARSATSDAPQLESSRTDGTENNKALREGTARTTWSGTARASTALPSVSTSSRLGAVGSGPSRLSSSKFKSKARQIEPKKPSLTDDVTASWNVEPKRRKSNNWATSNADPVDGQAPKRNYRLSVQNRIYKSRREGRVPDPNNLIFIDPKTGKAPTRITAPSATVVPSKTPLQLHQEQISTKEAEERQAQKVEDAMLVTASESDPVGERIDKDREMGVDEQGRPATGVQPETGRSTSNVSESPLRPMTGDMTDSPAHAGDRIFPPPAPSHAASPLKVPVGPAAKTERMATMSLQDYTKRSMSSTHLVTSNMHEPYYSSDDASSFTLRSHPSLEQKSGIFGELDNNLVIGDLVIGAIGLGRDGWDSIKVKLVGFDFELKKVLLTIKSWPRTVPFVFETVCMASEYQAYFPAEPSDYLGSGSIIPYPQSELVLENIAETLANNLQGGLFFAEQYTMLMYPAGASAWAFLDKNLPIVHPGTILRFVVRRALPPIKADVHRLANARLEQENPERYAEIATHIVQNPIQAEDSNINVVFRDLFEIDFGRLVAQNGPQQHPATNTFFLCFIPQGCEDYEPDTAKRSALRMRTSEEHDLFIKFLQANGAEEIYSMQDIGSQEISNNCAWDYFVKNVKAGTIIFHDAYTRYDLVPRLAKHLLRGSVNVWKTSLSPMHRGEKHPHLVRLFPQGGVLLLTESLILHQPREALRIVMWFRRVHIPWKASGTWKLAVRPRVREWLLDIMDACSDSGKDIFRCSIQIFADIYTEIYWLLQTSDQGDNGLMCYEWDYETPNENAPIVSPSSLRVLQARKEWKGEGADRVPDDDNIRQNDDLLVQWFAEWAIVNLQSFRKYNVILGYTKDHSYTQTAISAYEKAWGHIEVMTFEEAVARHRVTPQSSLDEMEAERRRKLQEELPTKKAATERARREERKAAKRALDARMATFRDAGATGEEVKRAGRQLLSHLGGSQREIEECQVDMDRVFVDRWWGAEVEDGEMVVDGMGTRGAAP